MKEPILYQLFGPKKDEIESPQERVMREGLRDIRDIIKRVEGDLDQMAEREECQKKRG
jgi:hypothetical protein